MVFTYRSPRAGPVGKDTMVKQSPHKRWKGHDMMCGSHKLKGVGRAEKTPWRELRKMGKKRRLSRRYYGDDS